MKNEKLTYRIVVALLALLTAVVMVSCSDDSEQDEQSSLVTIEAVPCGQSFLRVEPIALTRGWNPPTGFSLFDVLNKDYANKDYLANNSMDIFFTQDNAVPKQALFQKKDDTWRAGINKLEDATYYLYGFTPYIGSVKEVSISSSSTPNDNSSYSTGAVLTIKNLPSITAYDVCVVVGAKNGSADYRAEGDYSVEGLARGKFAYEAKAVTQGSGKSGNNFVFLLFEHLYSAMNFCFRVGGDYAALRTIKLKKLELQAYDSNSSSISMKRNVDATITLRANTSEESPISNVSYSHDVSDESNTPMDFVTIFDGEKELLSDDDGEFLGSFVPDNIVRVVLRSTYDVYDKKGNLVRKDCKADNNLVLSDLFGSSTEIARGCKYSINITIKPTYLYVLSEPDLDDPKPVVGD